jgi:hypothetical protein
VGSATNDSSREIGGALGIAIGGSVLNTFYQDAFVLPEALNGVAFPVDPASSFPAAMRLGGELLAQGNPAGQLLVDMGREAFMTGMTTATGVSALISLTAALFVFRFMPSTTGYSREDE